jgi:hypothetical protein
MSNDNAWSVFLRNFIQAMINLWESPWIAGCLAAFIYLGIAAVSDRLGHASIYAYYNYLADAFLHGQFNLRLIPTPEQLDLSLFQGKYYLNWGLFPALLFMPFVAIFGIKFNDVLFTALAAALCIGLFAQLLRSANKCEFLHMSKGQRALLVAFLTLGTVLIPLASKGKVWQTAQIVAFACTLWAYLAAFSLRGKSAWFFTGLALTCAMLSRLTTLFVGIFPLVYLLYRERPLNWKRIASNLTLAATPVCLGLLFFCYYNYARFGSILETGLSCHLMSNFFRPNFLLYGASNIHYFPINLYYEYLYYPFPLSNESMMGGSLFLLSPLFLFIFPAIFNAKPRWGVWALLASVLVTDIPIMFHMSTGYVTFGPRYTLDFTVPLLLLTALGIERHKKWLPILLAILSIAQYLLGTYGFIHLG